MLLLLLLVDYSLAWNINNDTSLDPDIEPHDYLNNDDTSGYQHNCTFSHSEHFGIHGIETRGTSLILIPKGKCNIDMTDEPSNPGSNTWQFDISLSIPNIMFVGGMIRHKGKLVKFIRTPRSTFETFSLQNWELKGGRNYIMEIVKKKRSRFPNFYWTMKNRDPVMPVAHAFISDRPFWTKFPNAGSPHNTSSLWNFTSEMMNNCIPAEGYLQINTVYTNFTGIEYCRSRDITNKLSFMVVAIGGHDTRKLTFPTNDLYYITDIITLETRGNHLVKMLQNPNTSIRAERLTYYSSFKNNSVEITAKLVSYRYSVRYPTIIWLYREGLKHNNHFP